MGFSFSYTTRLKEELALNHANWNLEKATEDLEEDTVEFRLVSEDSILSPLIIDVYGDGLDLWWGTLEHEHFLGCSAADESEYERTYKFACEAIEETLSGELVIIAASNGNSIWGKRSEIEELRHELSTREVATPPIDQKNIEDIEYLEFCWTRPRDEAAMRDLVQARKWLGLDRDSA